MYKTSINFQQKSQSQSNRHSNNSEISEIISVTQQHLKFLKPTSEKYKYFIRIQEMCVKASSTLNRRVLKDIQIEIQIIQEFQPQSLTITFLLRRLITVLSKKLISLTNKTQSLGSIPINKIKRAETDSKRQNYQLLGKTATFKQHQQNFYDNYDQIQRVTHNSPVISAQELYQNLIQQKQKTEIWNFAILKAFDNKEWEQAFSSRNMKPIIKQSRII